jgi:ferredoxin/flavodoxin---NADP+ reductase
LSSPLSFVLGADGRVKQVIVAENELVAKADGSTSARVTESTAALDVDTVLFAIGDTHDAQIGLPMGPDGYATRPDASQPNHASFEVWNPANGQVRPGQFVVGWARKASTGLAGVARHDGELGARQAIEYLKTAAEVDTLSESEIRARLAAKGLRIVDKKDLAYLACAEQRQGAIAAPNSFHFKEEAEIFQAIDREIECEGSSEDAADVAAD